MDANWIKPNVYVIQNGKLVPRPSTPQDQKNYRYIPFDPLTNPSPNDYFRQTIAQLQKQNTQLKVQLQALQEKAKAQQSPDLLIKALKDQISGLKRELFSKQEELASKNKLMLQKDKQIRDLSNEKSSLSLKIGSVEKEVLSLNRTMGKKDQEILKKKLKLEEDYRNLDKIYEKDQKTTIFSQNQMMTPKATQEDDSSSINTDHSPFRTPQIQPLKLPTSYNKNNRIEQQQSVRDNGYQHQGIRIISNFRNSLWSSQIQRSQTNMG